LTGSDSYAPCPDPNDKPEDPAKRERIQKVRILAEHPSIPPGERAAAVARLRQMLGDKKLRLARRRRPFLRRRRRSIVAQPTPKSAPAPVARQDFETMLVKLLAELLVAALRGPKRR